MHSSLLHVTVHEAPHIPTPPSGTVLVRYGTTRALYPVAGWCIGAVKTALKVQWGIDYFAVGVVNGQLSAIARILEPGDILEFRRPLGFKASEDVPYAKADAVIATYEELRAIIAEERDVAIAVRKTVRFCVVHLDLPIGAEMGPLCLLLERIALAVGGTAVSIEKIAEMLASLVGGKSPADQGCLTNSAIPAMMTVEQVANRLNVSPGFAYEVIAEGRLKHHRFGKSQGGIRVSEDQLLEFLRQTERGGSMVESQSQPDRKPANTTSFKFLPPPS